PVAGRDGARAATAPGRRPAGLVDGLPGRAGCPRAVGRLARGLSAAWRGVVALQPAAARAALRSEPGLPARRPQPIPLVWAPGHLPRPVCGGEGPVPALSGVPPERAALRRRRAARARH